MADDPDSATDAQEQHRRQDPDDAKFVWGEVFRQRFHVSKACIGSDHHHIDHFARNDDDLLHGLAYEEGERFFGLERG